MNRYIFHINRFIARIGSFLALRRGSIASVVRFPVDADRLTAEMAWWLNRFLPAAVGTAAVEVNQDFARLGTVALADDAAIFQFVHDARRAAVAEAQAAVQIGRASCRG